MITIVRLKMRNIKLVENDNDSKNTTTSILKSCTYDFRVFHHFSVETEKQLSL